MNPKEPTSMSAAPLQELELRLRQLDRRDWSLWSTTSIILILLCFAVFSFSISALSRGEFFALQEQLTVATKGLFALVLLFTVFALYQQYLIKHLRSKLQGQ